MAERYKLTGKESAIVKLMYKTGDLSDTGRRAAQHVTHRRGGSSRTTKSPDDVNGISVRRLALPVHFVSNSFWNN